MLLSYCPERVLLHEKMRQQRRDLASKYHQLNVKTFSEKILGQAYKQIIDSYIGRDDEHEKLLVYSKMVYYSGDSIDMKYPILDTVNVDICCRIILYLLSMVIKIHAFIKDEEGSDVFREWLIPCRSSLEEKASSGCEDKGGVIHAIAPWAKLVLLYIRMKLIIKYVGSSSIPDSRNLETLRKAVVDEQTRDKTLSEQYSDRGNALFALESELKKAISKKDIHSAAEKIRTHCSDILRKRPKNIDAVHTHLASCIARSNNVMNVTAKDSASDKDIEPLVGLLLEDVKNAARFHINMSKHYKDEIDSSENHLRLAELSESLFNALNNIDPNDKTSNDSPLNLLTPISVLLTKMEKTLVPFVRGDEIMNLHNQMQGIAQRFNVPDFS